MSMKPQGIDPIPEETRRVATRACKKGTLPMHLRDALFPIYEDAQFADLFPKRGREAEAPWRLALVTVLQALESLTDRQAAEAVRTRLDWKYALSLSLEDEGFDASVLTLFRDRLLSHEAQERILTPLLQVCRERGWLRERGRVRTDSTMILAQVRALNSLESVGESMRAALNALAQACPEWLLAHVDPDWFERYVHRFELARFPKEESKRKQLRQQVGEDVARLLREVDAQDKEHACHQVKEVELLRRVFAQHYEQRARQVHWRDGPAVRNEERIISPYDQQATESRKRDTTWLGYKVHLSETCEQDPDQPHLIIAVQTTPATTQDVEVLAPIASQLHTLGMTPAEHYVDQGYPSGPQLVEHAQAGIQLIAPVALENSWQLREGTGYAIADFQLDWQQQVATCPQGVQSSWWASQQNKGKQPRTLIRFPPSACATCCARPLCTRGKGARTLTVSEQAAHVALVERREEQSTPAFFKRYHRRAGIEGTISQALRTTTLRRSPYVGVSKTHLHHLVVATALNFVRLDQFLQRQQQGLPARPSRPLSPFAHLQARWTG
jgi:transposase